MKSLSLLFSDLKHSPENVTLEDLRIVSITQWQAMPTLSQGHTDNLKFESSRFRVWVSRLTLADYDGDAKAYYEERMTIELHYNGVWCRLDKYGKLRDYKEGEIVG